MADFPALQHEFFDFELANKLPDRAPPRILILYGSLREQLFQPLRRGRGRATADGHGRQRPDLQSFRTAAAR